MVEMYEESVEGVQLIHAVPTGKYHQALPTIFFYHGFLSSKELYSYFGYSLAQAGFRVVMPDALMHGARSIQDEILRLNSFWLILQNNVDELALLKEAFVSRGLADSERLGVGGVSMGGMTTMAAMVRFPWIKAAVNLMGSGYFKSLSHQLYPVQATDKDSPLQAFMAQRAPLFSWDVGDNLSCMTSRPLFVWHGEKDELVPCEESFRLEQALTDLGEPHRVMFLREAQSGHKISILALKQSVAFFKHHL